MDADKRSLGSAAASDNGPAWKRRWILLWDAVTEVDLLVPYSLTFRKLQFSEARGSNLCLPRLGPMRLEPDRPSIRSHTVQVRHVCGVDSLRIVAT